MVNQSFTTCAIEVEFRESRGRRSLPSDRLLAGPVGSCSASLSVSSRDGNELGRQVSFLDQTLQHLLLAVQFPTKVRAELTHRDSGRVANDLHGLVRLGP